MFPKDATYEQLLGPAMHITDETEARAYFRELVHHALGTTDFNEEEAEAVVKENLGYHAGYFSNDVRARVEKLFNCVHPFFGSIETNGPPSPEAAYQMGQALAMKKLTRLAQPRDPKRRSVWERISEEITLPPSAGSSRRGLRPGRTK